MMASFIDRLYRMIFCRGGHGVHSPFVFDLITKVIEEKEQYYCYESLSAVRRQLRQDDRKIMFNKSELAIRDVLDKYCFSECEDRLLFRIANYFKPEVILAVGSGLGLTPLYTASYSKNARCIAFEPEKSAASVARHFTDKYARNSVSFCDRIAPDMQIDLIVWGYISGEISLSTFEELLQYTKNEGVMIISGIRASSENKKVWNIICAHSKVSVTVDLYSLGIVFFNPKLHRRTYKCVIP